MKRILTLVENFRKTLKQNKIQKSKITSITRQTEAGFDAYDSGDKEQHKTT